MKSIKALQFPRIDEAEKKRIIETLTGVISELQKKYPSLAGQIFEGDRYTRIVAAPSAFEIFFSDLELKSIMGDAYPTSLVNLGGASYGSTIDKFAYVEIRPKERGIFRKGTLYQVYERFDFGRERLITESGRVQEITPPLEVMWIAQLFANRFKFHARHHWHNESYGETEFSPNLTAWFSDRFIQYPYAHSEVVRTETFSDLSQVANAIVGDIDKYERHGRANILQRNRGV